jgi:hypothetical protein
MFPTAAYSFLNHFVAVLSAIESRFHIRHHFPTALSVSLGPREHQGEMFQIGSFFVWAELANASPSCRADEFGGGRQTDQEDCSMRSKILLTGVAVAAVLAGTSLASAQGTSQGANEPKTSQTPGAQRSGQGSTVGQSQQRQEQGPPSSAQQRQEKGPTPPAAQRQEKGTTGQAGAGQSGDHKSQREEKGSAGQPPVAQQKRPERGTTGQAPGTEQRNDQMQRQSPSQPGAAPRASETTGRANANVNLSTEQRTRLRETVLKESNAPRVGKAEFSVSVGTVVPSSVRFVRLPAPIVEIYPAWRDYDYVVVGDQILILDPVDHRIVAVLDA